jgi:hypothetical protein
VACLAFYLAQGTENRNYGGTTSGLRWMFWFAPLWSLVMLPAVDACSNRRGWRGLCLVLLALSVLSVSFPTWNPWERSELWSLADSIPGMTVLSDPDGQKSRAFGSETSGHVLLYDPAGELVFSGGVTAARAHEGDNRGRDAIRNFTNEGSILEKQTPVFGCALRELAATPLAGVAGD